jgi:carbonic anhydrase
MALAWLTEGNGRWRAGVPEWRDHGPGAPPADGQWPFAAVLGCSDSRVPPEVIYDVTAGNLFTVRNAGNIVDDDVLGSLEFATENLGISLVVVLGHTQCGAVREAERSLGSGELPGGHVASIVDHILAAEVGLPADHTERVAIEANVRQSVALLSGHSSRIARARDAGRLGVIAAMYDLGSREVRILA